MLNLLRNKAVVLLAVLLIAGLSLGNMHQRALSSGRSFLIQDGVRTVLSPLNGAIHIALAVGQGAVRVVAPRYVLLRKNAMLEKEVKRLSEENVKLRAAANENVQLRAALDLRQSSNFKMATGEVISRNPSNWFDVATIDRGRSGGIAKGAAVITARGQLVGQVLAADTHTSQIVALTDWSSAVGAMVERSRSSGLLQGQGADYLVLAYLPKEADVKEGDVIVSSGMGGVIPKGLPIGRVVQVMRNTTAGTTSAVVRPSVQFDRIEQVFVVKLGQTPSQ